MKAKVLSGALQGVDAYLVEVEVDLMPMTLPFFSTVGLPEGAVKESKDRVRSAISNAGFFFPSKRITVNLAPAGVPKVGTAFDLPIAIGILTESGEVAPDKLEDYVLVGELSLDGKLRPIRGALPIACAARDAGKKGILLPAPNAREAAVVDGIAVIPVATLEEVVRLLNGTQLMAPIHVEARTVFQSVGRYPIDFQEVYGQHNAKRALEIAAAGGHNLLMIGPPGSGKTMLAKRLPSILPDLSFEEALETTKIYSVMGLVPPERALITHRPFRAPHHTISDAGLVGGGSVPGPGEISLSHNGVLFLDEMPEFRRQALEVMRQPLEDGVVTLARARWRLTFPARAMLVATMNPCPCGHLGDIRRKCTCNLNDILRYRGRLSGPLLDRIDIHVEVPALKYSEIMQRGNAESSSAIKSRVELARDVQRKRYASLPTASSSQPIYCNAQLTPRMLNVLCTTTAEGQRILEMAIERLGLSGRAYTRILKVARTVADLEGADILEPRHLAEAIQYRTLDRAIQVAPGEARAC